MKKKVLFFILSVIAGFALAFSFVDYSYADSIDSILLEMCLQKKIHGLESDCSNIQHTIKTPYVAKKSDIGVILSNSCLAMMNNNITSNCPDYDLLQSIYPSVIVDPDSDIIGKIRIITISASLPEYKSLQTLLV